MVGEATTVTPNRGTAAPAPVADALEKKALGARPVRRDHRDPLERKDTKGLRVSLETRAKRVTLDGMAPGAPRVKEGGWECPVFLASTEYREFPVHLDLGDLLAWTGAMEQREIQVAPASPVPLDLPVPPASLVRQASKENLLTANPEVKERKESQDETGK